ncbi:MAG: phosphatidylserine synthase [Verrucomicrobia bacterium]|nr:phosphatidylserine synthase [Verrucomicrobiota bacterium]
MHVAGRGGFRPFLGVLDDLVREGVDARLLHAKEPRPRFRKDFDLYPGLLKGLERVLCPRVHLKTIVVDGKIAYLGSANLTGAGMGAKSKDRRNFESGIITDEPELGAPILTRSAPSTLELLCRREPVLSFLDGRLSAMLGERMGINY